MDYRLTIGIPSGGTIKAITISSLLDALAFLPFEKFLGLPVGGYSGNNRNLICQQAIDSKSTHVMLVGPDVKFRPDSIKKLLDYDLDIVGANYNERKLPLTSTVKFMNVEGKFIDKSASEMPTKLTECAVVGSDFCLIKTPVFEKLEKPYFWAPYENGLVTEDVFFCNKARKVGYKVWFDPTIDVWHIGDYLY